MNRKTSWLLVLGLISSTTLGVQAMTTLSAKAQTKAPILLSQVPKASAAPQPEVIKTPKAQLEQQVTPQDYPYYGDASLCYTCGGLWPIDSGVIYLPSGSAPVERGAGCGGNLRSIYDTSPRLCSN